MAKAQTGTISPPTKTLSMSEGFAVLGLSTELGRNEVCKSSHDLGVFCLNSLYIDSLQSITVNYVGRIAMVEKGVRNSTILCHEQAC